MKQLKTIVLIVSNKFPATHSRKGQKTGFVTKILTGEKKHTIRMNYDYWQKKFEEIDAGRAYLSVRTWQGKPYRSKQIEIKKFFSSDGIGLQSLEISILGWFIDEYDSDITTTDIAKNDGLSLTDFKEWFKGKLQIPMEPMAIIHFTDFRYENSKTNDL